MTDVAIYLVSATSCAAAYLLLGRIARRIYDTRRQERHQ